MQFVYIYITVFDENFIVDGGTKEILQGQGSSMIYKIEFQGHFFVSLVVTS